MRCTKPLLSSRKLLLKGVQDKVEERRENNEGTASVARLLAYFPATRLLPILSDLILTHLKNFVHYLFFKRPKLLCFPHC
jgi:hypothetical protein